MNAYQALVPYADPRTKAAAKVAQAYRYCVAIGSTERGDVILFSPFELTTHHVPPTHLRVPTAYPCALRPKWLASAIKRHLKAFNRHGRRADRTTAAKVVNHAPCSVLVVRPS